MIMISLISLKLHLMTQIVTEVRRLSPSTVSTGYADRIKEALELQKYFVKAIAKFSVARMVCLGSDVALKVLDIIK